MIADLGGNVLDAAGTGREGQDDGPFGRATFNHPQGMALDGAHLYVADTENHMIRRLDLTTRVVDTVAGTGQQGRQFNVSGVGRGVSLNSPWDVVVIGRHLYIAMAGFHQVWALNLDSLEAQPFAGSGREDITDGLRLGAAMAQPSGITTDGKTLYVTDSETSSVRAIDLGLSRMVLTIVGEGLFEFGDQDGTGSQVRLQHPLGIVWHQDRLYVADTYNHKIKVLYSHLKSAHTYLGRGEPGYRDGSLPEFYEPGGLSVARGRLYIADTNNHAIRVADLKSGEVSTLKLNGLAIPEAVGALEGALWLDSEVIVLPRQTLKAGTDGHLMIDLELPVGYKLNPSASINYEVRVQGEGIQVENSGRPTSAYTAQLPLAVPFRTLSGIHRAELDVEATFYWCRADDTGVCMIQVARWHLPVETNDSEGRQQLVVSAAAKVPNLSNSALPPGAPLEYKKDTGH